MATIAPPHDVPLYTRSTPPSPQRSRASELAFQRRLLEGVNEEDDASYLASTRRPSPPPRGRPVAPSASSARSSEDAIRHHQHRLSLSLNADSSPPHHFPLASSSSTAHSRPYAPLSPSSSSSKRSWCFNKLCCGCSPRVQTCLSLGCGASLILSVLVVFIVLLHTDLRHKPENEGPLSRGVITMQLLGQTVLRYDVTAEQNLPAGATAAAAWMGAWSRVLTSDYVVSDLETSLLGPWGGIDWRQSIYSHIAPPETLTSLTQMGLNAWACANNHVMDLERPGLWNLLAAFEERNLTCAGVGPDRTQAAGAAIVKARRGKGVSLAMVALASGSVNTSFSANATHAGVNLLKVSPTGEIDAEDLQANVAAIDAAAKLPASDLVAVVHHNHYVMPVANGSAPADEHLVDPWRVALAHSLIDAGAMIYISHGVPVVQGIELYNGFPIFYGLGNFVFQSRAGPERWGNSSYEGVMVDLEWACQSCAKPAMPVASIGTAFTTMMFGGGSDEGEQDVAAPAKVKSTLSSADDTEFVEMGTDEEAWAAAHPEEAERAYAKLSMEERHRTIPQPSSPLAPPSMKATPVIPPSGCSCGFKLTSLIIRPLVLVRPDLTPPSTMHFNHSWGLPSLSGMTLARSIAVLEEVQRLSATFGTTMTIMGRGGYGGGGMGTHTVDDPGMHSLVFAKVDLV